MDIFNWLHTWHGLLGTRICWKSLNLNHFDIKWIENFKIKPSCTCILELDNRFKEKDFDWRLPVNSYSVLDTRPAAKFELVPSTRNNVHKCFLTIYSVASGLLHQVPSSCLLVTLLIYQSPKCDWALRSETQVGEGDKKDPSDTIRTQKITYTKKVVFKAKNRISKTHL